MIKNQLAPVSAIADVLALWNHDGWLTPPLQPVVAASAPVAGRALTITVGAGLKGPGFSPIYDVLSRDLTGRILILAGADAVPGAVWGEILTRAALQQGASAVLVEGWVRDRPVITDLGLPIYATGEHIAGPSGLAHITAIDAPITIHSTGIATRVASHDLIVVDATGCVRVPATEADDVLLAANKYAAAEDLVVKALNEGEPLARAYHHKKSIAAELRR